MLLYIGPDLLMPIASVLGAIGGAILLFWSRLVDLTRAVLGRGSPAPNGEAVSRGEGDGPDPIPSTRSGLGQDDA